MSRVVGIDPGKSGAIAVLDGYGELCFIEDMPVVGNSVSPTLLLDMIEDAFLDDGQVLGEGETVAVVEQVHSMPKQGVASSFDFGKSYGIVLGVLAGARVRVEHVPPTRWKKALRLSADKEMARRRAIERWPGAAGTFKRKRDGDRAEAALIALWWIDNEGKS